MKIEAKKLEVGQKVKLDNGEYVTITQILPCRWMRSVDGPLLDIQWRDGYTVVPADAELTVS